MSCWAKIFLLSTAFPTYGILHHSCTLYRRVHPAGETNRLNALTIRFTLKTIRTTKVLDGIFISHPEPTLANTVGGMIRNLNWTKNGSTIEKGGLSGKRYVFCTGQPKQRIPLKEYVVNLPTNYEKRVNPKKENCSR